MSSTSRKKRSGHGRSRTLASVLSADPRSKVEVSAGMLQDLADMIEDVRDAAILARRVAEDDGRPGKPLDVIERLIDGQNAVRVHREWRGLTQVDLAAAARLSQGHIADIENGKRSGSIAAIRSIAVALNVPIDDLVQR